MHKIRMCLKLRHTEVACRLFGSSSMKVAILGAAGKTGTCLSLFLKQSPLIDELSLYDVKSLRGIDFELNNIDTSCKVRTYIAGKGGLKSALENAKIVVITAAKANYRLDETSYSMENLLANANVLKELVPSIISYSPKAMVAVVTDPINSLIPMTVEMYKKAGILEHNRIFGVTSLDCMKANTFLARHLEIDPECVTVPVIGGHCRNSCVPVFSQAVPRAELKSEDFDKLLCMMKKSYSCENIEIRYSNPSLALASGFAIGRFCISLCKALKDKTGVLEYAFVRSSTVTDVGYFAEPIELGPNGVKRYLGLPTLNPREAQLFRYAKSIINEATKLGERLGYGKFDKTTVSPNCPIKPCDLSQKVPIQATVT